MSVANKELGVCVSTFDFQKSSVSVAQTFKSPGEALFEWRVAVSAAFSVDWWKNADLRPDML